MIISCFDLTQEFQLTNTIQKRLNISSTQLLYQSAPFQAAILFVTGPMVDQFLTKKNVFAHKYSNVVLVSKTIIPILLKHVYYVLVINYLLLQQIKVDL